MKTIVLNKNINIVLFISFALLFGVAFAKVHLSIQSTLIGYELGRLKNSESQKLEERSQLQMTYAKITKKANLSLLAQKNQATQRLHVVAAKK